MSFYNKQRETTSSRHYGDRNIRKSATTLYSIPSVRVGSVKIRQL